jgi:hypothetical protein
MIDTCTVYYFFIEEIPINPKITLPITPNIPVDTPAPTNTPVSTCEMYMCALIIQVILGTAF